VLLPQYLNRDRPSLTDKSVAQEMGRHGLPGTDLPEALGGLEQISIVTGMVSEALAYGDFNLSAVPVNVSLNATILMAHAPAEVRDHIVPQMSAGEKIMAICLAESRGGSDAANLAMTARRRGSDYVLNGEKTSITCVEWADVFLVFARTGDGGAHGVSAFFVPAGTPGISRLRFDNVGSTVIGHGSLFFEDVVVPERLRLGAEGKGSRRSCRGSTIPAR